MQPGLGIFLSHDPVSGDVMQPESMNGFNYAEGDPANRVDPTGQVSEEEKWYMRHLYNNYIKDTVSRLHDQALTNLSDGAFAAMIAAKFLVEDATPYADSQPFGRERATKDILMGSVPGWVAIAVQKREGQEYSWGPANIPMSLADRYLAWWEETYAQCPRLENFQTEYYRARSELESDLLRGIFDPTSLIFLNIYAPYEQVAQELLTDKGAVEGMALAILESSDRARKYWRSIGQPSHELSAYTIALGVLSPKTQDDLLYPLDRWKTQGFAWDWVDTAVPWVANFLGLDLGNFLKYTGEEKAKLDTLPHD